MKRWQASGSNRFGRNPGNAGALQAVAAVILVLAAGLWAGPAWCGTFDALQEKLIRDGFDAEWIHELYAKPAVRFEPEPVRIYFTIQESKLNYRQFLLPKSVRKCGEYAERHKDTLKRIEQETQVPASLLVALFMVETRLGTYTGAFPVLNVLSSLSVSSEPDVTKALFEDIDSGDGEKASFEQFQDFCRRKAEWAYGELKAFISHARDNGDAPESIQGSLAGAIGIPQFLPSNVARFGTDGNGDGKVDLFAHEDALFSAARFLASHGWKPGLTSKQKTRVLLQYNRSGPYTRTVLELASLIEKDGTPEK